MIAAPSAISGSKSTTTTCASGKEDARKTGEIESLQRTVAQFTLAEAGARKIAKKAAAEQPAA